MDQSLRVLFDRALDDEPLPQPGDLAQEAMAGGRRLRRRRRLLVGGGAGGVAAVAAAVLAFNVASTPPPTPTAMALATKPFCTQLEQDATGAAIFLRNDITDQRRADLDQILRSDPRVAEVRYESREAAYQQFKEMYQHEPDLVEAVKPAHLPESFRITLTQPSMTLLAEIRRLPGVETVVGTACAKGPGVKE